MAPSSSATVQPQSLNLVELDEDDAKICDSTWIGTSSLVVVTGW